MPETKQSRITGKAGEKQDNREAWKDSNQKSSTTELAQSHHHCIMQGKKRLAGKGRKAGKA